MILCGNLGPSVRFSVVFVAHLGLLSLFGPAIVTTSRVTVGICRHRMGCPIRVVEKMTELWPVEKSFRADNFFFHRTKIEEIMTC